MGSLMFFEFMGFRAFWDLVDGVECSHRRDVTDGGEKLTFPRRRNDRTGDDGE